MSNLAPKGPIPIVVAVTGHTDLRPEDVSVLSDRVREVLRDFQFRYPRSPLELLSPLAEGADRLAARVALELGIRLVVPLPLAPDDYKKDFSDAASVREFDELKAQAWRSFVVAGPNGAADARPQCYARVGAYSVTHAHLVVALWNGLPTSKIGGTAQIVRYRLEGIPPAYSGFVRMLDPIERGVVHHIVTPRRSDPKTMGEPFTSALIAPDREGGVAAADAALQLTLRNTDAFNVLALKDEQGVADRRRQSETQLRGSALPPDVISTLRPIVSLFGCADELAIRFQRRTRKILITLFLFVLGAVMGFELFHHTDLPIMLAAYVVLLFAAYRLHKWATVREFESRYLDYRALAEGLRVLFYWRAAGIRSSAADYYMRYRLEEAEWIRHALRSCEQFDTAGDDAVEGHASASEALRCVVQDWVEGQHAFFVRAVQRDHALATRLERVGMVLWIITVLGAAAMVVGFVWEHYVPEMEEVVHMGILVVGIFTAAFALTHGYLEKRAVEVHIKRYTRMRDLFGAALRAVKGPLGNQDAESARSVLRELGREALEENADWVMLHRERPLEVPQ